MHQEVYDELTRVAKAQTTTFYSDIAPLAGLDMERQEDRNTIAAILDEISRREHENKAPLLSAVVVLKGDNRLPGDGFFKLAKSLGVQRNQDNVTFFSSELTRVHDHWHRAAGTRR